MKFENTEVWGFQAALRGMRNPKNSWDKSDSEYKFWCSTLGPNEEPHYCNDQCTYDMCHPFDHKPDFIIGPNDMKLAQTLIKAGPEHRKFLRQIFVTVDITAPLYFLKEFDTYKIGTTANSTSTMHKLTSKEITLDCFEIDDFDPDLVYYSAPSLSGEISNTTGMLADILIEQFEFLRKKYLETKDKKYWKELVRWLPCGWLQTRTWSANYEVIRSMCQQRRNHKLNEWSGLDDPAKQNFIAWAHTLPYAEEFIFYNGKMEEENN